MLVMRIKEIYVIPVRYRSEIPSEKCHHAALPDHSLITTPSVYNYFIEDHCVCSDKLTVPSYLGADLDDKDVASSYHLYLQRPPEHKSSLFGQPLLRPSLPETSC